jgi:hypothetical protein
MGGRPWTPEEDEVLRALAPTEVARQTGRSLRSVYARRNILGLGAARLWKPEEDELVRTLPAAEVAERTGRTLTAVYQRRQALRVTRPYRGRRLPQ